MSRELTQEEAAMNHETWKHIHRVRDLLSDVLRDFIERAVAHDQSKLALPEVEIFAKYTPKLKGTTYGSDEYKGFLQEMKPALDHHYENNSQ